MFVADLPNAGEIQKLTVLFKRLEKRAADPKLRRSCVGFGMTECPPLAPPAEAAQLEAADNRLGFAVPALLRTLYLELANGGFGPGFGLFPAPPSGTSGPWRGKNFCSGVTEK